MRSVFLLEAVMPLVIDLHDLQLHSGAVCYSSFQQNIGMNGELKI